MPSAALSDKIGTLRPRADTDTQKRMQEFRVLKFTQALQHHAALGFEKAVLT